MHALQAANFIERKGREGKGIHLTSWLVGEVTYYYHHYWVGEIFGGGNLGWDIHITVSLHCAFAFDCMERGCGEAILRAYGGEL